MTARMFVKHNPDTGAITETARGTLMSLDLNVWTEVTNDPKLIGLFSSEGAKKFKIIKDPKTQVRKLHYKPEVQINISTSEIEDNGLDGAIVSVDVVKHGFKSNVTPSIKIQVGSKLLEVAPGEEIAVKSSVANRLTVMVIDDRVFIPQRERSKVITARNQGGGPPDPPVTLPDVVVRPRGGPLDEPGPPTP